METADQVAAVARDWLARNGQREDWFLHVHLWDPHTPYRTPTTFGAPFRDDPVPSWLTEEVRLAHWGLPGPHSAQEIAGFGPRTVWDDWPRQPQQADSLEAVRRIYDGYDIGVRYADHHVGQVLGVLEDLGIGGTTAVMVSADHGENLGELGIYCDHQTADQFTTRLPMVLRWPGLVGSAAPSQPGLHYQIDVMATVLDLFGAEVPDGGTASRLPRTWPRGRRPVESTSSSPMPPGRPNDRFGSGRGSAFAPTTMHCTAFRRSCCSTWSAIPSNSTTWPPGTRARWSMRRASCTIGGPMPSVGRQMGSTRSGWC